MDIDAEGFAFDPAQWSEDEAQKLAEAKGVGRLSQPHWKIIYSLRDYYQTHGHPPALTHVCWRNDMNEFCLTELFSNSKLAWQIAGLPDPGEEAKTYMSDW